MPARQTMDGEEGFTMVELMVAFIILALIVFAAFNLLDVNIMAGTFYKMRADISQELRETTGTMVDQLRTARSFTGASSSDLSFTSYLTGTNDEYNVQFFLDDGDLIHRFSTAPLSASDNRILASNVTRLEFKYYDSAGSLLDSPGSTLGSIYVVEVELTMTLTSGEHVVTETVETVVRIRK